MGVVAVGVFVSGGGDSPGMSSMSTPLTAGEDDMGTNPSA